MKFIKAVIVAGSITASAGVYAQSAEEVCHNAAQSDLGLKHLFIKHPNTLHIYIDLIKNRKDVSAEIKMRMRETAYWVHNRKDLSDEGFIRLAFLRCFNMIN